MLTQLWDGVLLHPPAPARGSGSTTSHSPGPRTLSHVGKGSERSKPCGFGTSGTAGLCCLSSCPLGSRGRFTSCFHTGRTLCFGPPGFFISSSQPARVWMYLQCLPPAHQGSAEATDALQIKVILPLKLLGKKTNKKQMQLKSRRNLDLYLLLCSHYAR